MGILFQEEHEIWSGFGRGERQLGAEESSEDQSVNSKTKM